MKTSFDPNFKPRDRECGRGCGRRFTTSPRWRYFCHGCRHLPSVRQGGRAVRFNPQENSRRGSRMTAQGSEVGIMNAPRAAHGRQLIGKVLKLDGNASGALYGPGISF